MLYTGRKPTKRTFEMVCFCLSGLQTGSLLTAEPQINPSYALGSRFFGFLGGPSIVSADAATCGSANGRVVKTLPLSFHFRVRDL
jgi:hypothetical protein